MMFDANPELLDAFYAHYLLHKFFQSNYVEAGVKFIELIEFFKKSQSIEIIDFVNTLLQWKKEIINSFIVIEGHGKISINDPYMFNYFINKILIFTSPVEV